MTAMQFFLQQKHVFAIKKKENETKNTRRMNAG